MKILHIINSLGCGGAESLLSDLCLVQKEQGGDISIATLSDVNSIFKDKIKMQGIKYIGLSSNISIYNPIHILKIAQIIKEYDLVHVHLFPAQYWVAVAKFITRAKTPIITTEHSTSNRRRNRKIFKHIDTFVYRLYNRIVCCSDKAYETFRHHFPSITSVDSIPNGINLERFKNATSKNKQMLFNLPNDACVITMVARFQPPKRQDALIEALKYLPENFCAVFVGNKPDDPNVEHVSGLIKDLKLSNRVRLLGVRSDIPDILKSSDIIALASDYEGLSLSSIEGMAVGKPFIATSVNGLREVVSGFGVLYEKDDIQMFAMNIYNLMQDTAYYNKISEQCYTRASRYDITKMSQSYMNVYRELLQ